MNLDDYDRLIKACYLGPLEKSLWFTFLQEMKRVMQARYVTLLLRPPRVGDKGVVLNALMSSEAAFNEYNEHYFSHDPFVDLPLGKAMTADEMVDMDELKQTDYYRNYLKPVDVEYILGVDFVDDNGYSARLRVSRGAGADNFTNEEKQLLERVAVHLQQATTLHSRIVYAEVTAQSYQEAFNHMEMGCIILDRNLAVQSMNRAAADLMKQHPCLQVKDRQLLIGNRDEQRRFRSLVDGMLQLQANGGRPDVAALRVETPNSVAGIGLLCRAMPPAATPDAGPSLVVFCCDPERPRLSKVTVLEQLFGLTLSEARLALLLANGFSLDESAEELGITRNTAKSHLSSTFTKTGVTRQPSLVQLILRSVASIG